MLHAPNPTLAICNGVVINESWSAPTTVIIAGSQIVRLQDPSEPLPADVNQVIDADGKLLLPGAVDPHCHVKSVAGAYSTLDGFAEAGEAALWGGTTTLVDFAIPEPGERPVDAARRKIDMAADSPCDVALHGCVTGWWDDIPQQLEEMRSMGISTIKLFTTYRDTLMASPATQRVVLTALKNFGGLAYIHAESNSLIEAVHGRLPGAGGFSACNHPHTRPEITEAAAVDEILGLVELLDAPAYFVHQTTPEAVDAVVRARRRGLHVFSETCPHYLLLDESKYAGDHPERFVCCPPLRSRATANQLRRRVLSGSVHTIGSDHNCFSSQQKIASSNDVRHMPNGLPGVELRLPVLYSDLVATGSMAAETLIRMVSANPARLNGLYPRKGALVPGADADVVIFDPSAASAVSAADLHMPTDYSPYEGLHVKGWPTTVVQGGRVVIDGDGFHARPDSGSYIPTGDIDYTSVR